MKRRNFLGLGFTTMAVAALQTISSANILKEHPAAFDATKGDAAIKGVYGTTTVVKDDKAVLKLPDIAENGGAVPVTVSTSLDNAKSMALIIDGNPRPLAVAWELQEGTIPKFSTRIKMRKTGKVRLIVEDANGKLHEAIKQVKVTVGGCGG
ncbi:MAG: thiosulfate oxidation carrier protein SoxY [Sulfurospirillum sp.]